MPSPAFLRRWQFSLRELLLLTVIVALLLTIWRLVDFSGLTTTAFFNSFGPANEMQSIAQELGHPIRGGSGGGGGSSNDQRGIKKYRYGMQLPAEALSSDYGTALRKRILQRLAQADCELTGDGTTAPQGFSIEYRHGDTIGIVNADTYVQDGELNVVVLIHEFKGR